MLAFGMNQSLISAVRKSFGKLLGQAPPGTRGETEAQGGRGLQPRPHSMSMEQRGLERRFDSWDQFRVCKKLSCTRFTWRGPHIRDQI